YSRTCITQGVLTQPSSLCDIVASLASMIVLFEDRHETLKLNLMFSFYCDRWWAGWRLWCIPDYDQHGRTSRRRGATSEPPRKAIPAPLLFSVHLAISGVTSSSSF